MKDVLINIEESERDFLVYLALNGPSIGNHMKPDVKNASRTAKGLKERDLIFGELGKYDFSPTPAEKFSLTVSGLLYLLWLRMFFEKGESQKSIQGKLDNIIKHWSSLLPLVFEKWSLFKEHHVEEVAMASLFSAYIYLEDEDYHESTIRTLYTGVTDMNVHRAFYLASVHHINRYYSDYQDKWMSVCREDNEICEFLTETLEGSISYKDFETAELWHNLQLLQDHNN